MTEATERNEASCVPETLDYTEKDFRTENKRKVVKEGWIKGVVRNAEKRVTNKSKNLEIKLHICPVDENNNVFNWAVPMTIYPVMANPAVPGHLGPNKKCLKNAYSLARCIDKDFPRYAKKSEEEGKYVLPDGTLVDKRVAFKHNDDVDVAVKMKTKDWYVNPELLKDEVVFAKIIHETGLDGNIWAKVLFVIGETPKEPLMTTDFLMEV